MNIVKLSVILLIELILQSTVFQFFNLSGRYPDLLLISLICFSILLGRKQSYTLGFVIGLLGDILYGDFIGLYALSFLLTAFITSVMSENMFKDSLLAPISVFPIGVIINHGARVLILYLIGNHISIVNYLKFFNLTYWVINFMALLLIYPLLLRWIRNSH